MLDTRKLGAGGPEVSAVGLGCMAMSGVYGAADRGESEQAVPADAAAGDRYGAPQMANLDSER
jgi:aryl-alcohol dehydrogenase-like predicted oxidoreductase